MASRFIAFDDVRKQVTAALKAIRVPEDAPDIYVVRDMFGRVGISIDDEYRQDLRLREAMDAFARQLSERLGAHGRPREQSVLWVSSELLHTLDDTAQELVAGVRLADRLVVGGSWWTVNGGSAPDHATRYALYSVKGGVGRSTTAAILAWHLARQGEDVLAIDLDIESPGLASVLLEEDLVPDFGVSDWFVEELVGQGDNVVNQMAASPKWTRNLHGNVQVAPAYGRNPGEYLAKLGRVYMDTVSDPWAARLQRMLAALEASIGPTVVLIECRSGLHDIAATAITDLDAEVLLFGSNSSSTWNGYKILFEHWQELGLARHIRDRLTMVSGLTPELNTDEYLANFRNNSWDLFRDCLYDTLGGNGVTGEAVSYDLQDEDAPHNPLVINWNRGIAAGTPLRRFEETTIAQAYAGFLHRFDRQHRQYTHPHKPITRSPGTTQPDSEPLSDAINSQIVREALRNLPEHTQYGDAPPLSQVYAPPAHRKALDPNVALVTGMRGSGKTFWWAALQDPHVRGFLAGLNQHLESTATSEILLGFGVSEKPDQYPGKDEIRTVLGAGIAPRIVWRTVHACQVADSSHDLKKINSWTKRASYVQENANEIAHLFSEYDESLNRQGRFSLLLLDGLDRSADNWSDIHRLIRGLMQHALDMRAYRRIRAKVFLRSDQVDERRIANFPDASKITATSVELEWLRSALYGLLWQYLANGLHGKALRKWLADGNWRHGSFSGQPYYTARPATYASEQIQRERFHTVISGPWMGTDRKRGFPYTWIPNHLADAEGRVSPRSFIAALKTAADDTARHYPSCEHALHFTSIKRGVQEASQIRVNELREDYPWVDTLLSPLRGEIVPCDFERIEEIWRSSKVFDRLANLGDEGRLPPPNLDHQATGVREDLEELGVFKRLKDGRVNIPDVFRIGYGLGRKGGVKPLR